MNFYNNRLCCLGFRYKINFDYIDYIIPHKSDFKLCPLTEAYLQIIEDKYSLEVPVSKRALLRKRLLISGSDKPYVVLDTEANLCGFVHIAFGSNYDTCLNVFEDKSRSSVYLFDDYSFKKHRNRGVHSFSVLSRLLVAKKMGFKMASVHIIMGNKGSEKSYTKYGFEKDKAYLYIKKLKLTLAWCY